MTFDSRLTFEVAFHNEVNGRKDVLATQKFTKAFSMISGQFRSKYVWINVLATLFTDTVATAINNWAIGDGNGSSYWRSVYILWRKNIENK